MALPLVVVGLILRLTNGWFHDQHVVGNICMIVGVVLIVIQLVFMWAAWNAMDR